MIECLLQYFIQDGELKDTCDFNSFYLKKAKNVYEVVRVINGKVLFAEDHIQRFLGSIKIANMKIKLSGKEISERLTHLIQYNRLQNGNIRFQLYVYPFCESRFLAWVCPHNYPTEIQYKNGVQIKTMEAVRPNPNAKCANLKAREQANAVLKDANIFEVLYVNNTGHITEGSRSNFFFIKDDILRTAPVEAVLPGITRKKVIDICRYNNISCIEAFVSKNELDKVDAVFLCGSSPKILSVSAIDVQGYNSNHPLISMISELFEREIQHYLHPMA